MNGELKNDKLDIIKYINDPVYGGIPVTKLELELIDTPYFQRLRDLKQLSHINFVFPGAEHSRYSHSLGVFYITGLMADHLHNLYPKIFKLEDVKLMRVAALLHDIGHYPLSHLGENVFGYCSELKSDQFDIQESNVRRSTIERTIPELSNIYSKAADHEELGKFIIENNKTIKTILENNKIDPCKVGEIFCGKVSSNNAIYVRMLHSSLDADRLDYLIRDSFQTGVRYGVVDFEYLIKMMMIVDTQDDDEKRLSLHTLVFNKKGQYVIEHFLMARYFHYLQVIFHKTNVAFNGLINCLYAKLLLSNKFIFNSLQDIHNAIKNNDDSFMYFTDSFLEKAMYDFYSSSESDDDYKMLYEMYKKRNRPSTIFDRKYLIDSIPSKNAEYNVISDYLLNRNKAITEAVGTNRWGYAISKVNIEKYREPDTNNEAVRYIEAIRLYDKQYEQYKYIFEDSDSIISILAKYSTHFVRIYLFDKIDNEKKIELGKKIDNLINKGMLASDN